MKDIQKEINYWQSKFRILNDWKINYNESTKHTREVCHSHKIKKATIHRWGVGRRAKDYIFHEILHICQCEIRSGKEHNECKELEEKFVQDLSNTFRKLFKEKDIDKLINENR